MTINKPDNLIIGKRVYLDTPKERNIEEFLYLVEVSKELHTLWVAPPATEEQYLNYLNRISKEQQQGFLCKLQNTNEIVGVINRLSAY